MVNNLFVIIILISSFECVAQGCLKKFFKDSNFFLFLSGIICYAAVCYLLVKSYQFKSMGIVNCIWSGVSILFILWIGWAVFNETINTRDVMGIAFIISGIWFIMYDGPHGKEFLSIYDRA
jgi:multidrug transporter EmrE-like cation transporter